MRFAKKIKWLRILFIASLALNILVIGILAGAALKPGGFAGGRGPELGDGLFSRALSEDDRREMRERLRPVGQQARTARGEAGKTLVELTQVLRSEPFDPSAAAALFDRMRTQGRDLRARGHDALLLQISGMTPAERAQFADRLEQELARQSDRRH